MKKYSLSFLLFTFVFLLLVTPSKGDQYYSRLTRWYSYAQAGDWDRAAKLESKLNQEDLIVFKRTHQPAELKKYINALTLKKDKSPEDWLELARVQSILGKSAESLDSLTRAKDLDPIREDISRLYYQTK